jgi:hypothetical protein
MSQLACVQCLIGANYTIYVFLETTRGLKSGTIDP